MEMRPQGFSPRALPRAFRVSSDQQPSFHPILRIYRLTTHRFAAARGTPVAASGKEYASSRMCKGYGNCIDIRHTINYFRYGFVRDCHPSGQIHLSR